MVTNIHEHKRYYYNFDNSLLFTEHLEHYTNLSTLKSASSIFRVSTGAVGTQSRVRAKPVCASF